MKRKNLQTFGGIMLLIGLLTSPAKTFALRCRSNPAGWLEAQCQQFRELHWPWGYAFLLIGALLIVVSLFAHKKTSEKHD
ncbi:hypothetical protein GRI38_03510 [Altererythrobacter aurantiacus]|uniref:Uncharacterized protein n=1 Tax=Parapontixanthobacter aurantiacus TaxID=1463599 RepID=A0A844ZD23_9SPHN|nr:hypothetical protein [Parapontixanthobacter aurantiacus]MXO85093.1 hypothetical protein [Parapontixanthobacter aurantiacus]